MHKINEVLNSAKEWLIQSGIQNIDGEDIVKGSFNAWYDPVNDYYEYIYSEITGYGASTLLCLYNLEKKDIYLKRAELTAEWLLKNANKGYVLSIFKHEKSKNVSIFKDRMVHSFDNGIILRCLTEIYQITKDKRFLDTAIKIAEFLVKKMYVNGTFYPLYDVETGLVLSSPVKWSTLPGSYHTKDTMGFINLYEITGKEIYREISEKVCKKMMGFQQKDGRFVTYENGDTHLHPHSYSAEGLLFAGIKLNNQDFVNSALRALQWSLNNQLDNGGIPFYYNSKGFSPYERTDILAQTIRLGVFFLNKGLLDEKYKERIDKCIQRLCQFQCTKGSIKEKGGFQFGYDFDGKRLNHVNSWCTMFSIQALEWYLNGAKVDIL